MPEEITQNETTFNRTEKTPLPPPRITAGYGEQKVLTQLVSINFSFIFLT